MGRRERKSQPSHTCLTNLFMNIHVQLLSTLVFCSIAFCLDNSCSEGRPHRNPVSPFPMNMIWTLPAKCQVPWISTVDMMMPQWQPTDGCSHNRGERKGGGTLKDWGEQGCCYISVPLLALSIAPTTFSKEFWVTKEAGLGGQGGGSWANTMALSHSPISFTVIKMNRDLSYWAQVHMRHELVTWWGWTNRRGKKWGEPNLDTPPLPLSSTVLHLPNTVPIKLPWMGLVCLPRQQR